MTPTARSLAWLRKNGWIACVVERWIAPARRRVDAFGFGDILAVGFGPGPVLVQVTTGDHLADRRAKIEASVEAGVWRASGGRILLHGWSKQGPRGKRKLWTVRTEWL